MKDLNTKITNLEYLLKSTYSDLNNINQDSFNEMMPGIRKKMSLIVTKRNDLILHHKKKDLTKYDKKLYTYTKQIQEKFDNIIEWYRNETLDIAKKLVQIGNSKKLAKYVR